MPNYLDLFAGAGGLSEGFIQAGYTPVAHVEMDAAACNTLKTRTAYHWLKSENRTDIYRQYLNGEKGRDEFYETVPDGVLDSVLNYEISEDSLPEIFDRIDALLDGKELDLIVGGPPCQAYSIVGRARSESGMVGDQRNYLYKLYARFLQRYRPKYFVFENVAGLLSAKDEDGTLHFDETERKLEERYSPAFWAHYRFEQVDVNYRKGILTGRLRLYSLDEQEPSRPMYVSLRQTERADGGQPEDEFLNIVAYVSPNQHTVTLKFELPEDVASVRVGLYTQSGLHVADYQYGEMSAGVNTLTLQPSLTPGYYAIYVWAGTHLYQTLIVI